MNLRALARGRECQVRIPGIKGGRDADDPPARMRSRGRDGMLTASAAAHNMRLSDAEDRP